MALRLGPVVEGGEIINLTPNSVHGLVGIRGADRPLHLQLTGNCTGELAGKYLRFEVREDMMSGDDTEFDLSRLAWDQVGPTGEMSIREVRVPNSPLPRKALYLEWFSQNGRVVLELLDPEMEFVDPDAEKPVPASPDIDEELIAQAGPVVPGTDSEFTEEDSPWENDNPLGEREDDGPDDPYGLFPSDLEEQFEEQAFEADKALMPPDLVEFFDQMDEYDEDVSSGEGVPIREIFDPPMRVYRAEDLDDEQVAVHFHTLLARLALHGIALDMCRHYTPREAYKLLVEKILIEERTYPRLAPRGFVQHYMTHEYCPACDAEMQAKYGDFDTDRSSNGDDDSVSNDDIPF